MGEYDKLLDRIYTDPNEPSSFSSIVKLYDRARQESPNITINDVRKFLRKQVTYTLHRPYRKHFVRNKTVAQSIDYQWQADLADLVHLAAANDKSRYILTVIDVFSRYAWAIPVSKKTGVLVRDAFKSIFDSGRIPKNLQTDRGKEFFNKEVAELLKSHGMNHFATNSDQKAALAERFNRTLKMRMSKYLHHNNTHRYLDILPTLISGYNSSVHRSIGLAPAQVTLENSNKLWQRQYGQELARGPTSQLDPNTVVRISKVKGVFEKGDTPNWTEEMFRLVRGRPGLGRQRVYKLEDWHGEPIEGQFYEQEVQAIEPTDLLYVERVIRKRKVGKRTDCLVKWRGWPDKFNRWIDERELIKINGGEPE